MSRKNTLHTQLRVGGYFFMADLLCHVVSSALGKTSPDYWLYYLTAICVDMWLILKLSDLADEMWIAHLMVINFIGVFVSAYGLVIWCLYLPPNTFNDALYAVAAIQWIRLIWVDTNGPATTTHRALHKFVHRVRSFNFTLLPNHRK